MSSSSSSSSGGAGQPGSGGGGRRPRGGKRAIALRRTLYSPAVIAFSACVLKVLAFGFKPLGILMTCTMLGVTVPFGPHTLWDTVPACAAIGLLLYFTSRMELDGVAQALIGVGGLLAIFFSWKLQGPLPQLPRRVPQYIQQRFEQAHENEAFKQRALGPRGGASGGAGGSRPAMP